LVGRTDHLDLFRRTYPFHNNLEAPTSIVPFQKTAYARAGCLDLVYKQELGSKLLIDMG
jgi:hypothetical protein